MNRPLGIVFAMAWLGAIYSVRAQNEEVVQPSADVSLQEGSSPSQVKTTFQEKRLKLQTFQSRLEQVQSIEEKKTIAGELQKEIEKWNMQQLEGVGEAKSGLETLAELKAKAAGDPGMLQRIAQWEGNLLMTEGIKTKLAAIKNAQGEQKQVLLEELQSQHEAAMERLQAQQSEAGTSEEASAREELIKKKLQEFQEALRQVPPEERVQFIEQWRAQQEAAAKQLMGIENQNPL